MNCGYSDVIYIFRFFNRVNADHLHTIVIADPATTTTTATNHNNNYNKSTFINRAYTLL